MTKKNNKTTGVVRVIRVETVGNHVPRQQSNNQNGTENEAAVPNINESEIENAENVGYYNDAEYADYLRVNSDT